MVGEHMATETVMRFPVITAIRTVAGGNCYPRSASILLSLFCSMRIFWWIPVTIAAVGAGVWFRARRRRRNVLIAAGTPVSEQWLAQARGREEHQL